MVHLAELVNLVCMEIFPDDKAGLCRVHVIVSEQLLYFDRGYVPFFSAV